MVITKDIISFSFIGDEEELDRIPFVDIDFVKDPKNASLEETNASGSFVSSVRIEIVTKLDGYNSGRTYYLKTTNVDTHTSVLKSLIRYSKLAKKNQSSPFIRAQETARCIYEHNIFQAMVALIILAVSLHLTIKEIDADLALPCSYRALHAPLLNRNSAKTSPTQTAAAAHSRSS